MEGLRLVRVQCTQCGWNDGYGLEVALPKYVVPGDFTARSAPSMPSAEQRRSGLFKRILVGLVVTVIFSGILSTFYLSGLPSFTKEDRGLPSGGSPGGRSQAGGESNLRVEEFVLKTYDSLAGFTDAVRPMRVVETWEGIGPSRRTVDQKEAPWLLFWSFRDTASLGGTFALVVTREGASSAEVIDTGSGANYAVMQGTGVHEIAVQALDVNWQVWALLEE